MMISMDDFLLVMEYVGGMTDRLASLSARPMGPLSPGRPRGPTPPRSPGAPRSP